ncbi:MAG: hypothetical protein NTAFB05_06020 [Nitrobacter sp.]|uniref:hypothetical protein n=1 Tax=Nitrobacter sp. TaxID=29420 RepID=UPI00387E0024
MNRSGKIEFRSMAQDAAPEAQDCRIDPKPARPHQRQPMQHNMANCGEVAATGFTFRRWADFGLMLSATTIVDRLHGSFFLHEKTDSNVYRDEVNPQMQR